MNISVDIISGNKVIAEFMGYRFYDKQTDPIWPGWRKEWKKEWENKKRNIDDDVFLCKRHRDLKYHSSYDWLMPVVQRIEDLGYYVKVSGFSGSTDLEISEKGLGLNLICQNFIGVSGAESKIDVIWLGVVDFIRYYKKQLRVNYE